MRYAVANTPYVSFQKSNTSPIEPYVVIKLGSTFNKRFRLGERFQLDIPTHGTDEVVITGFYREGILAFPQSSSIFDNLQREFFQKYPIKNYKELRQDEYNNLYPDELNSLPLKAYPYGLRVLPELRSFPPDAYF